MIRINKKIRSILLTSLISAFTIALIISCARPVAPTGGPKDENPPKPLRSKPINYSTNFNDDKIIIQFDEFVVLKDINQELLVSPPLEEEPEIKQRGKNLIINIESELQDSTTYGINFYESITDLNEGNVLKNFQFEFSTGDTFDSLYVAGNVKNAFNFKTEKGLFVLMYSNFNDSLPRTTKPDYISKTDENGNFIVSNLKNQPYYIFVVKDLNNNKLFDLPNEEVAFLEEPFQADYHEVEFADTITYIDSISPNLKDTVFADSVHIYKKMVTTVGNIQMFLFKEDVEQQYFVEGYRPDKQQVIFAFNEELTDSCFINPIVDSNTVSNWFVNEPLPKNDSIIYWIKDSSIFNIDSLEFEMHFTMKDSNEEFFVKTDTVLLYFETVKPKVDEKKEKKDRKFSLSNLTKKNEEEVEKDTVLPSLLTFKSNAKTGFDLNKQILLDAKFPVSTITDSLFSLVKIEDDTVEINAKPHIFIDSTKIRAINIEFEKDEEEKFELFIPSGAISDIYGNINDTLNYKFTTQALDYYGTVFLHIENVKSSSVVQMLSDKEELIEERYIENDTTIIFNYLHPKNYIFKLYYDKNNNKKWDTGNLSELLQPEDVFYFPEEVNVKSNFDYEYDWNLYAIPKQKKKKQSKNDNKRKLKK